MKFFRLRRLVGVVGWVATLWLWAAWSWWRGTRSRGTRTWRWPEVRSATPSWSPPPKRCALTTGSLISKLWLQSQNTDYILEKLVFKNATKHQYRRTFCFYPPPPGSKFGWIKKNPPSPLPLPFTWFWTLGYNKMTITNQKSCYLKSEK